MTREEFIQKHGYDPETEVARPIVADSGGGVLDHLKSAVVGVGALPTDLASLPQVINAGAQGLYQKLSTGKPFLEAFAEDLMIEGGPQRIQEHLKERSAKLQADNPQITDDQHKAAMKYYQDSKEFEDFKRSQSAGAVWASQAWRDTMRGAMGDTRPESQRSWTESAAEVVGGALVPGPAGWATKVGNLAAAKGGAIAAVAANPVTKTALKTAEILTPATMPYSGTNIALNIGAGLAIDQGVRAAQGQSTAFTPTADDPAALGTLAAVVAGAGGIAAFIGAMKGRSQAALQQSVNANLSQNLRQDVPPAMNLRMADPVRPGEPLIVGGPPQELKPPSRLDDLGWRGGVRRFLNQTLWQGHALEKELVGNHPTDKLTIRASLGSNNPAVLQDAARSDAENALRPLVTSLKAVPQEELSAVLAGMQASSIVSHWRVIFNHNIAQLDKLHKAAQGDLTPRQAAMKRGQIRALQKNLARFMDDTNASARIVNPAIPMSQYFDFAKKFETNASPYVKAVRDALENLNNQNLDLQVRIGKLDIKTRNAMRGRNKYYNPLIADPLQGKEGVQRWLSSISYDIKRRMVRDVQGTGSSAVRESPIVELGKDIPGITRPDAPETRVTAAIEPLAALGMYTERLYRDVSHSLMRNENIPRLMVDELGNPTDYAKNGNIRPFKIGNKTEFSADAVDGNPAIQAALSNPHVVPTYSNGRVKLWELGDREYAAMLRQDPIVMNGLTKGADEFTRWFKFFTTGKGNPSFAVTGAAYDWLVGITTQNPNRSFGPISTAMHHVLPEQVAKHVAGRLPDPTSLLTLPYHAVKGILDVVAYHTAATAARQLQTDNGPFAAFARTVGPRTFQAMLEKSMKIATRLEHTNTMDLLRSGAVQGIFSDDTLKARTAYNPAKVFVPEIARKTFGFYSDIINAVYISPKRMFFTENDGLLKSKLNKGKIQADEYEKQRQLLLHETRVLGGDMSKIAGGGMARSVEAGLPYAAQIKLGTHHMIRSMSDRDTATYTIPKIALLMYGMGQSFYMMTYWDKNSRDELWKRTNEDDRYRFMYIPTFETALAWLQGKEVPFSRDKVYKIKMAPDYAPIIAGSTAMMQMMGMIPANVTPEPLLNDVGWAFAKNFIPAMPPAVQAVLATAGMKLDPQGADTRGNIIANFNKQFRAGPEAEAASNLGEVSNSVSLIMGSLAGSMGYHVGSTLDVMLHAAKHHPGTSTPQQAADYGRGFNTAMGTLATRMAANVPDVPPLWQGQEKYKLTTPDWQYVAESNRHIQSIKGMRTGPTAEGRRAEAQRAGGLVPEQLTDKVLTALADEVAQFSNPTGDLGKLQKQYTDLLYYKGSVDANYNLPHKQRTEHVNTIVKQMQDIKQQQMLAIKWKEEQLGAKYGELLAPQLRGRVFNMNTIDTMLRESRGAYAATPQQQ